MKNNIFRMITIFCFICLILTAVPMTSQEAEDTNEWTGQVRIEGKTETIFTDVITVNEITVMARNVETDEIMEFTYNEPTALGALVIASNQAGFSYELEYYPSWDSIIINSINNDTGWWHYYVDYNLPMIGVSSFILSDQNTSVLFGYLEDMFAHALQIKTDTDVIKKHEDVTISVTDEHDLPVPNATIHVGDEMYQSDEKGNTTVTISKVGTYMIYAEKDLCIRSETLQVQVQKTKSKGFDLFYRFTHGYTLRYLLEIMVKNLI